MTDELVPLRPNEIFAALDRHGVVYVLIGGLAAILQGSPFLTVDADICPDPDPGNLDRLANALIDLDARVYTAEVREGLPFDRSRETIERASIWNLVTRAGRLDLNFEPIGTRGFSDLRTDAITIRVDEIDVPVASLADVVRSKEAAGRDKDVAQTHTLRQLLDRIKRDER